MPPSHRQWRHCQWRCRRGLTHPSANWHLRHSSTRRCAEGFRSLQSSKQGNSSAHASNTRGNELCHTTRQRPHINAASAADILRTLSTERCNRVSLLGIGVCMTWRLMPLPHAMPGPVPSDRDTWQAAALEPGDFEATYNHALALQELASHTANQPDEQMRLLQRVRDTSRASRTLAVERHQHGHCKAAWDPYVQSGACLCRGPTVLRHSFAHQAPSLRHEI